MTRGGSDPPNAVRQRGSDGTAGRLDSSNGTPNRHILYAIVVLVVAGVVALVYLLGVTGVGILAIGVGVVLVVTHVRTSSREERSVAILGAILLFVGLEFAGVTSLTHLGGS